jgi:methylglutaconyl-CoA hydratase
MASHDLNEAVRLEATRDGIATVTLNRPAVHNAFDEALIERLGEIFDDLGAQDGVRLVFLQAVGKSFAAGADLNWMKRAAEWTEERNFEDAQAFAAMMRSLDKMPKLTVALVQGSAYGGGVGLIAACDIAIGVRGASFSLSEVKLGIIPAVISPYAVRAMGARHARRYFLTGEVFDAAEAQRIGLLHEVVADADELAAARDRIARAAHLAAPGAVAAAKDMIAAVVARPIDTSLGDETARRIAERRASAEGREGVEAFLAKRKPSWVRP